MREDRGSAIVLLTMGLALLLLALGLIGGFAVIATARARAAQAADLAALAAASADSCDEGSRVARANGARLEQCVPDGTDFQVVAATEIRFLGGPLAVRATARAGY